VGPLSDNVFVVRFIFTPKIESNSVPYTRRYAAVVEIPKNLVQRRRSELIGRDLSEKAIALDLARQAAFATLSTGTEPVAWPCHEDALWYEDRPNVMDEKPHDHEENGVRVWTIALATGR
jgi:hypothetical protein